MREFTVRIDDALLRAAERHALENGRTVGDLVRQSLARKIGWTPGARQTVVDDATARTVLLSYSSGGLSRRRAMDAMGLSPDAYADFAEAMMRSETPWPQVDRARVEAEGDIVALAISEANGDFGGQGES